MPTNSSLRKVVGSVLFQVPWLQSPGPQSNDRTVMHTRIFGIGRSWFRDARAVTRWVALSAILPISSHVKAGDWELSSSLAISELYTDNVRLSQHTESDDLITELSPSIALKGEGARINLDFNYSLRYFDYQRNSDLDDLRQTLNLASAVELIPSHLFLNVDSSISQQLISSRLQGSNSAVGSSNVLDAWRNSVSASWTSQLGNVAELELDIGVDQVDYIAGSNSGATSSNQADSTGSNSRFRLANSDEFHRVFWSINYSENRIDYENNEQGGGESGKVSIGYRWSKVSVSADTGWARFKHRAGVGGIQPDNDFDTVNLTWHPSRKGSLTLSSTTRNYDQGTIDPDAKRRSIGGRLIWTPNVRTSLELSTGNDFYGDSYGFGFNHKSRKSNWFVNYNESITDLRELITVPALLVSACPAGSTGPNDSGCHQELVGSPNIAPTEILFPVSFVSVSAINAEEFLNKRGTIGYTFNAARTNIGWTLFQVERLYLTDSREERDTGISLNWNWNIGRFSNLGLSVTRTEKVFSDGTEGDFVTSDLNFSHKLGRKSNFSTVIHIAENVDRSANNSYSENHIRFQLSTSFK